MTDETNKRDEREYDLAVYMPYAFDKRLPEGRAYEILESFCFHYVVRVDASHGEKDDFYFVYREISEEKFAEAFFSIAGNYEDDNGALETAKRLWRMILKFCKKWDYEESRPMEDA